MKRVTIIIILTSILVGCTDEESPRKPSWEGDFDIFKALIAPEFTAGADSSSPATNIESLRKTFVGAKVQWRGTLRTVRKGRVYFSESFVQVDEETKASVVMYYTDPDDAPLWEAIKDGAVVNYKGIITEVRREGVVSGTPPVTFVELRHVKPVR